MSEENEYEYRQETEPVRLPSDPGDLKRIADLTARLRDAEEGLKKLEWSAGPVAGRMACPACGFRDKDGHDPDGCWLNNLLRKGGA